MCVSRSRGRTGPTKVVVVGIDWPNRSSSPGPERLNDGAVTPTSTVCPAAETSCIGVTSSETAIDSPATMTISASSPPRRCHRRRRTLVSAEGVDLACSD